MAKIRIVTDSSCDFPAETARELGFYMQKYCGCVFSEADRYQKQIDRDKAKFAEG